MKTILAIVLTAIIPVFSAHAQQGQVGQARVDFTADTAHCRADVGLVVESLNSFGRKAAGWNWVVVCNSETWDQLLQKLSAHSNTREAPMTPLRAFTSLDLRYSFIYHLALHVPDYHRTIAHELAHVILGGESEFRAEELAERLLARRSNKNGAVKN